MAWEIEQPGSRSSGGAGWGHGNRPGAAGSVEIEHRAFLAFRQLGGRGVLRGVWSPASRRRARTRGFATPAFAGVPFANECDGWFGLVYAEVQPSSRMEARQ